MSTGWDFGTAPEETLDALSALKEYAIRTAPPTAAIIEMMSKMISEL